MLQLDVWIYYLDPCNHLDPCNSSILMLFYYLAPLQNDSIVTSAWMNRSAWKAEYADPFLWMSAKWTKVCISIFHLRANAPFSLWHTFFFSHSRPTSKPLSCPQKYTASIVTSRWSHFVVIKSISILLWQSLAPIAPTFSFRKRMPVLPCSFMKSLSLIHNPINGSYNLLTERSF